ncbi:MAG: Fur family transcriptional regulator [Candidatus Dormibacteraceae bacterium]
MERRSRDDAEPQAAFVASLRARGLRATPQRVVLHRIVREIDGHVTADALLARAAAELPSVSLPTIYAALTLLERMDEVHRVSSLGGATIYDTRRLPHHHAVCRVCGKVQDLEAPIDSDRVLQAARATGFTRLSAQVTVQGLCAACAARATEPAPAS